MWGQKGVLSQVIHETVHVQELKYDHTFDDNTLAAIVHSAVDDAANMFLAKRSETRIT